MSRQVFKLPDLGEGTVSAEIVAWHVKPGDVIAVGAELATFDTGAAAEPPAASAAAPAKSAPPPPAPATSPAVPAPSAANALGRGPVRASPRLAGAPRR